MYATESEDYSMCVYKVAGTDHIALARAHARTSKFFVTDGHMTYVQI